MATGNVDCVYCSMKEVLPGVNSFAVLHPDLMNEWNHLDNYLLCDPDQILDNCITPVCWTCPVCAHDYKCSPKQRILYQKRNMDACTFCKGLRRKERHYIWLREGHFTSLKMGKVTFNINYATGDSSASGTNKTEVTEQATQAVTQVASQQTSTESYILNTNTKKFHRPSCSSVKQMKESNKKSSSESRDALIAAGYDPCKKCNP